MEQVQQTSNKPTYDGLLKTVEQLGVEAGRGRDSQSRMFLKVIEHAYHGVIDLDKNKHGADVDDATKISEAYVKAQTGATMFDTKSMSSKKLISCVRILTKLGGWTKGGTGEPLSTVNSLMTVRQKLRAVPANAKKLDDPSNTLLKYARLQVKRDQLIPDDALQGLCFKKEHSLKGASDIIEDIRRTATALRDGKASKSTAQDNSQEVQDIIRLCTKRLRAIASKAQV